jgi:glycosyltransferase involved in cell wall biosynthesis
MRVLLLCEYPPSPGGLATQGDLLYRGLKQIGVEVYCADLDATPEKEWYYRWLRPDVVVGIGYWGYVPQLVLHPQRFGLLAVPWLLADGFIADYTDVLNSLPLILVTSNWVKQIYHRDGVGPHNVEVLPVGCDTDLFIERDRSDARIKSIRESFAIADNEILLMTVGGDAASKGAQEVMQALALIKSKVPPWKYVCKVWDQPRTEHQNVLDMELAARLDIAKNVIYTSGRFSRNFMPFLLSACDIYAAPSRLEGFGMPQVEAGACCRPVLGIKAMAMLDTLVHGQTGFLAAVAQEVHIKETVLADRGLSRRVIFKRPRVADYRASVHDIAQYLLKLMTEEKLRTSMGAAARQRVVDNFDYRVVARKFVKIIQEKMGIE